MLLESHKSPLLKVGQILQYMSILKKKKKTHVNDIHLTFVLWEEEKTNF